MKIVLSKLYFTVFVLYWRIGNPLYFSCIWLIFHLYPIWKCLSVDASSHDVPSLLVFLPKSRQRMSRHHAVTAWCCAMPSHDVRCHGDIWWHFMTFDDIWPKNNAVYHDMSWHFMTCHDRTPSDSERYLDNNCISYYCRFSIKNK